MGGSRTVFQSLSFLKLHVPSIQNELLSNETASSDTEPASAERHLILYGMDVEIRPKWTPRAVYPPGWGVRYMPPYSPLAIPLLTA